MPDFTDEHGLEEAAVVQAAEHFRVSERTVLCTLVDNHKLPREQTQRLQNMLEPEHDLGGGYHQLFVDYSKVMKANLRTFMQRALGLVMTIAGSLRCCGWGRTHSDSVITAYRMLPEWQQRDWQVQWPELTRRYCMFPDMAGGRLRLLMFDRNGHWANYDNPVVYAEPVLVRAESAPRGL